MLILVGVTINVALNGGLFSKAEQATKETEEKTILEEMLAMMEIKNNGQFDYETIISNMRAKHPEYTIVYSYPNATITGKLGTYNYIVSETEIKIKEGEDNLAILKKELEGKLLETVMNEEGFLNPEITLVSGEGNTGIILFKGEYFKINIEEDENDDIIITLVERYGNSNNIITDYLFFVDTSDDNATGIFINADLTVEVWLMGPAQDYDDTLQRPWVLGTGNVIPYGEHERAIKVSMLGKSVYLGYLTDDNNLYYEPETGDTGLLLNQRLSAEKFSFTQIYDTQNQVNEIVKQPLSYGLIEDEGLSGTGIYYQLARYKEKYDVIISKPLSYKTEDGVIYLEKVNSSGECTGEYEAMPEGATLR